MDTGQTGREYLDELAKDPKFMRGVADHSLKMRLRGKYVVKHVGMRRADRRELASLARRAQRGTLPKSKRARFFDLASRLHKAGRA